MIQLNLCSNKLQKYTDFTLKPVHGCESNLQKSLYTAKKYMIINGMMNLNTHFMVITAEDVMNTKERQKNKIGFYK